MTTAPITGEIVTITGDPEHENEVGECTADYGRSVYVRFEDGEGKWFSRGQVLVLGDEAEERTAQSRPREV